MTTTATHIDALHDAETLTGHIPEPWADYLEWVLLNYPDHPTAHMLRSLVSEVIG